MNQSNLGNRIYQIWRISESKSDWFAQLQKGNNNATSATVFNDSLRPNFVKLVRVGPTDNHFSSLLQAPVTMPPSLCLPRQIRILTERRSQPAMRSAFSRRPAFVSAQWCERLAKVPQSRFGAIMTKLRRSTVSRQAKKCAIGFGVEPRTQCICK